MWWCKSLGPAQSHVENTAIKCQVQTVVYPVLALNKTLFYFSSVFITGFDGWLRLLTWGQLTDPSLSTLFPKAMTICETLLLVMNCKTRDNNLGYVLLK